MTRTVKVGRQTVEVRQTLVDRLVEAISPKAGMDRLRARVQMEMASPQGGYQGGRRDRRQTRNWRPVAGSANADIQPDLPDLRARSRDLARNIPIATGAINTAVTNIAGEGLAASPSIDRQVLGLSDEAAEEWERAAAKEWALWCSCADFTGVQDFNGLQGLALRAALESGDVFAVRRYRDDPGDAYGLKVQLVEADRVSNPNQRADQDGMIGGVSFDGDGRPVGYSIASRHPGDFLLVRAAAITWATYPARGADGRRLILHLFDQLRPDQARGVPYLAPVIEALKVLGSYSESEATAALVASMFTTFVTSEQSDDAASIVGESSLTDTSLSDDELKLAPGAVIGLAPGEKVEMADPTRPNPAFDAFVMAVCRQIGVALELPYELLIKHFTASYSASRAALETAWQFFRRRRAWLAARFCQPIYEWVIEEAVARGRLTARGFFSDPLIRHAWCRANWVGSARISLDPLKDANADKTNLENCTTTRERIIQERFGGSMEQTIAQLGKEQRAREAAGIMPEPPPPAGGQPAAGDSAAEEDEVDSEDDSDVEEGDSDVEAGDQEAA